MLRKLVQKMFVRGSNLRSPGTGRRPRLEALEDRCVPTGTVWIGNNGGLWSNPANWSAGVPNGGDTAVFSMAAGGSSTTSFDDIPNLIIGGLTVDNTYGSVVNLNQKLTVAGQVNQSGGTIAVTSQSQSMDFTLAGSATYNWTGGTLAGPGAMLISFLQLGKTNKEYASFNINGGQFLGASVVNDGFINWLPTSPTLYSEDGSIIKNNYQFNIETAGTLFNGGPDGIPGGVIDNRVNGVMNFNPGAGGTVNIEVQTGNYGTLNEISGALEFTQVGANFLNEGTVNVQSNTSLLLDGPYIQEGGVLNIAPTATMTVTQDDFLDSGGAVINNGQIYVNGNVNVMNGGTLQNAGGFSVTTGNIYIDLGGTVELTGPSFVNTGTLFVQGDLVGAPIFGADYPATSGFPNVAIGPVGFIGPEDVTEHAILEATSGTPVVNGEVLNEDTVETTGGTTLTVNGPLVEDTSNAVTTGYIAVTGTGNLFTASAGTVNAVIYSDTLVTGSANVSGNFYGQFTVTASTSATLTNLNVTGDVTIAGTATVGVLIVVGDLDVQGTLQFLSAGGGVTVSGDYTQSGVLDIQLGVGSGNDDNLTVQGSVILTANAPMNVTIPPGGTGEEIDTIVYCSNIEEDWNISQPAGYFDYYLTTPLSGFLNVPVGLTISTMASL